MDFIIILSEQQSQLRDRRLTPNTQHVAFHAVADAYQSHLDQGQPIIFETVLLNAGDGYHDQHGVFIAPVDGIYVFSVSVMNQDNATTSLLFEVSLYKEGVLLGRALADGRPNGLSQGSITATTQLQEGDDVWVAVAWPITDAYMYGRRLSSFTGFLLAAL